MNEVDEILLKVHKTFDIVGKKWNGMIIYVLMSGPKRFSELHSSIPSLSKRMLNERMKELEEEEVVVRHVTNDRPVRIEYTLTKKGHELGKALEPISKWAIKWIK